MSRWFYLTVLMRLFTCVCVCVQEAERREVDSLTQALERHTPLPGPTAHLRGAVAGAWRLLYTTVRCVQSKTEHEEHSTKTLSWAVLSQVTIRGGTRTKLGLRGALTLGELQQVISCDDGDADASGEAVNDVAFSLVGAVHGHFTVRARYNIASPTRVAITYSDSTLEPQQLQAIFGEHMPLLLSIFNPEGWCVSPCPRVDLRATGHSQIFRYPRCPRLDITYVDDTLRVGRDDKGNTFVLERMT